MPATTVKVEGELLRRIERAKPAAQTVTAFVREAIERELRRRTLTESAVRYAEFLGATAAEREAMEEWEAADLAKAPRRRR